jgi:hypothetical protein
MAFAQVKTLEMMLGSTFQRAGAGRDSTCCAAMQVGKQARQDRL